MIASSGIGFVSHGRSSDLLLPNRSKTIFVHELNDQNDLSNGNMWGREDETFEVIFSDQTRGNRPITPMENFSFIYGQESIVPSGDSNGGHVLFMKNDMVTASYAATNNGSKKLYACVGRVSGSSIIWNTPILLEDNIPVNAAPSTTIRINSFQFVTSLPWFGPSIKMYACTVDPITSGITFSLPSGPSASPGDGLSQRHRFEDTLSDDKFIFIIDTGDVNTPDEGIVIGQLIGSGISASMQWGNVVRPSTDRTAGSIQDIRNITIARLTDNTLIASYKPRLESKIYTRTYSISGLNITQNPEVLAGFVGDLFLSDSDRAPQIIALDQSNWVMDCWKQNFYTEHWLIPGKIVSGDVPIYNFAKKFSVDGDFYRYDRFGVPLQNTNQFIGIFTFGSNGFLRLGTSNLTNQNIVLRRPQRYNIQGGNGNFNSLHKTRGIIGHAGPIFKTKIVDLIRRGRLILPSGASFTNIHNANKIQLSFWAKNLINNNTIDISKDFRFFLDSSGINLNNLRWNKNFDIFQDFEEHFVVLDFDRIGASGFNLLYSLDGNRFENLGNGSGILDNTVYDTEIQISSDDDSIADLTLSELMIIADHNLFTTDKLRNMYLLGTEQNRSISEYKDFYDIYSLNTKIENDGFILSGSGLNDFFVEG